MNWLLTLDALGTFCGLVYLLLELKAHPAMWIVSMVMPAIDLFVYYGAGLYADFGMDIYYLLIAIYGFAMWTQKSAVSSEDSAPKKADLRISHIPLATALASLAAFLAIWALMYYILSEWTNSTVPILDSFCNSLSIIALWMLAQKYVEQWLVWLVVDGLFCGLYIYKGIPFHGALYGFYTVMAVVGYRKWLKMMREQAD